MLAKQLVELRRQKTRNHAASTQITALASKGRQQSSMRTLGSAIAGTTAAARAIDAQMPVGQLVADMNAFAQEQNRMELKDELIEETLDSALAHDAEEEEQEAIIGQVLDEIGIETSAKVR